MRPDNKIIFVQRIGFIIILLVLIACNRSTPASPATPSSPTGTPENTDGLTPNYVATLSSLEKLDSYPLYVMHYVGDYDYPNTISFWNHRADFACSLFAALNEAGDMFYGRNFDWEFSPALLLFTDPSDGYASASMVDMTFIGITPSISQELADLPLVERTALLRAPSMPFDGMNEYGLAIGMAAVPEEYMDDASYDPSRHTIGLIGIIRQVLDHARDINEAVDLFNRYNIDISGGPPIHYLVADRSGKSVLIEFYQKEMHLLYNEVPWHLATNHLRCIAVGDGGCLRYKTLAERLNSANGLLEPQTAMDLLSEVKQDVTQWSSVYDITSGDINLVIGQNYDINYSFHLDQIEP